MQFHFDQSKIRSQIRLREGRMKPIDILSKNLNVSDDFDIEINEPYTVFKVMIFYILIYNINLSCTIPRNLFFDLCSMAISIMKPYPCWACRRPCWIPTLHWILLGHFSNLFLIVCMVFHLGHLLDISSTFL